MMMPTQFQFIMRVLAGGGLLFSLLLLLDSTCSASSSSSSSSSTSSSGLISLSSPWNQIRGGGAFDSRSKIKSKKEDNNDNSNDEQKVFSQLAQVVSSRQRNNLQEKDDTSLTDLSKALKRLAGSQQAFKGLDGAAHEAYQRTHSGSSSSVRVDEGVSGRASRSAARMAATAEGLLACELIELLENSNKENDDENEETLSNFNRTVLVNETIPLTPSSSSSSKKNNKKKKKDDSSSAHLRVLVLYESDYDGGAGLDHGNLEQLLLQDEHVNENDGSRRRRRRPPRGRLLVILQDSLSSSHNLVGTLQLLDKKPQRVKLSSGLVNNEIVSVQPVLYKAAGALLEDVLEPVLRRHCTNTTTAVHFVGQSLAGGVASLAATLLDGTLPMPKTTKSKSLTKNDSLNEENKDEADLNGVVNQNQDDAGADDKTTATATATADATELPPPPPAPLNGLGRGRSSALSLGAPPCLSSNVLAAYCTSFLHGDDVVCRTSQDSLDRLCQRLDKQLYGGVLGRNMGWMTDTLSLTMSNLKSHAHGSEGEEIKLAVPGRAFLVRPRRLGGICSIHEVGNLQKGGREALRAGILWQLHDVLVSKSMWKHHELEAYIHGLDRIQLRGIDDGGGDNDDEMY